MATYALYLESGPQRRKTMVHVLDLLGCIAKGVTTEVALAGTPDAIRTYLRFLRRHGEAADPTARFTVEAVEHVTEGQWLGNGDPALVFRRDLDALTTEDADSALRRLDWTRADVLTLVRGLPSGQLNAEPGTKGRTIRAMLEHMLESEHFYVSCLGRVEGLPSPGSILQKRDRPLLEWMAHVRAIEVARLRALTPQERSRPVVRWQQTWTARKVLRRMLEHEWEHLVELSERLGQSL
jgi:uncharacterized damage-inducible protein DinB/predicted RNase H-like HicB family nuclease